MSVSRILASAFLVLGFICSVHAADTSAFAVLQQDSNGKALVFESTSALKKGDRVALIGFGTFSISQRKARNGRNPQTGEPIKIPARRKVAFTPAKTFKESILGAVVKK